MIANVARTFDKYFEMIIYANRLATERNSEDPIKLIQLRRDLSTLTEEMRLVVDKVVGEHKITDTHFPLLAEHRAMFGAERSAVSNHQSNWTAPAMARDRAGYQADVKALFKMHEDNHRWRKQTFIPALEAAIRHQRGN